jgi:hypothetical protein
MRKQEAAMGTELSSAPPYQGNPDVSHTSVVEAQQGQGPEGQHAPAGTVPVAVEPGDTISGLMAQQGLNWNDPAQRSQFIADNPQFADAAGGRNPDLIWPGEVLYVRPASPQNGAVPVGGPDADGKLTYQNYQNGQPVGEPYQAAPAANGQPVDAQTFAPNGNPITTDRQGNPRNGYFVTDGDSRGNCRWVRFENGVRTEDSFMTSPYDDTPDPGIDPATGAARLETDDNGIALNGPVSRTERTPDGTYQAVTSHYVNGVVVRTERGAEYE